MKNFKKLGASLLALVMALAMVVPAMAANVVLDNGAKDKGHKITAYQIFTADVAEDGVTLNDSTLKWDSNVKPSKLWDALAAKYPSIFVYETPDPEHPDEWKLTAETLNTDEGARAVAKLLKNNFDPGSKIEVEDGNAALAETIVKSGAFTDGVELNGERVVQTGYCAFKDEVGSNTTYMLWTVTQNGTVNPKEGKSRVEKTVWQPTIENVSNSNTWQDGAIYTDIAANGDSGSEKLIQFKIKVTLPDNLDSYNNTDNKYKFTLHDKMDKGLSMGSILSVNLYASNGTLRQEIPNSRYIYDPTPGDNDTFDLTIENVKDLDGVSGRDYIEVIYTASLTDEAQTGTIGNNNNVKLEVNGKDESEDDAKVYELELTVDKVDADRKPLSGARFTLYSADQWDKAANKPLADAEGKLLDVDEAGTHHSIKGMAPGTYYLVESTKPGNNYTDLDPIEIKIEAAVNDAGLSLKVTGKNFTEAGAATIMNLIGTLLPETGGIGTTIFYIAGGVLAVGAVVLLVTKRRVNSTDDE